MLDVVLIVSSDPRYDARSTKFLSTLLQSGMNAKVIGISADGTAERSEQVVRIPLRSSAGKKFFMDFYRAIVPEARSSPARVIIAGDLFSLPPAVLCKRRSAGIVGTPKLVYDSKELYKELPSLREKRTSFIFWNFIENKSIPYVDRVLTVNESIAQILEVTWHKPVNVVMNVPDISNLQAIPPRSPDKIYLAFSGGLQPGRGLHDLVRLLTYLPQKYELRIIGDGRLRPELESQARMSGIADRVHFVGRVRNSEVVGELSACHIGVYLMENTGLCHYLALPNKLFQFISARLPVVVPNFPEMEKIVGRYDVGIAVDPSNIREAARSITEIASDRNIYNRYVKNCEKASMELNWQVEKEKFLRVIRGLI